MARPSSTTLQLPPFYGATRKLILLNVGAFFLLLLFNWVAPAVLGAVVGHLILVPSAVLRGEIWQLATYSVIDTGLLSILFGSMTLWFAGSLLEGSFGSRWVAELYATSVVGGALLASLISFTHLFGLRPDVGASGAWAGIFGVLVAIAMRFGDQEFLLWFVLRLKAKYMVAIYILIAVAVLLRNSNGWSALLELCGALAGFLYVRFAPRRGYVIGMSQQWLGLRNGYYRWKRRRAAKKFAVYMRKQNRVVHFDAEGRYVAPEDEGKYGAGPNGRNGETGRHWKN